MTAAPPLPEAIAEDASPAGAPQPQLAMPPRPAKPLSSWQLLQVFPNNSLAACDAELFEELFVERRYLFGRLFVISDPEGVRQIFQTNPYNYERVRQIRRAFSFSGGGGVNYLEGEAWWRHRRMINPAIDHRALQPDLPRLIELAEEMARHLLALPAGQEIDIGRTLTHLVTHTTSQVFVGGDPRIEPTLLRLGRYPENYGPLDVLLPERLQFIDRYRRRWGGIEEHYNIIDQLIIERRRADYAGGQDLLWRLANARDPETGEPFSLAELRDEMLTLSAGAQAPLRTLTWGFYLLDRFPAAERQLHAELDAVLGRRSPTPGDFSRLTYLRRLIDETMRLYPPLPVMLRVAVADDEVCGRHVPKGSYVAVMPWVIHRHRKLWPDPDRFDPGRFTPERSRGRPYYAYIPFAAGPRACIAASLGMWEIMTGMAVLAQRLRFRLVPDQKIEPTAWSTLRPRRGITMTVEPR